MRAAAVVPGIERAAREHDLSVEVLTPAQVEARWAGFQLDPTSVAVFDPRAGYLHVERCVEAVDAHAAAQLGPLRQGLRCVEAAAAQALAQGAELRSGVRVDGWRAEGEGVVVETDQGSFAAGRLVLAPGAWAPRLLGPLWAARGIRLRLLRKSLFWFDAPAATYGPDAGFPCFLFEGPLGVIYGFPRLDEQGLKLAAHSGGRPFDDPDALDRAVDPDDEAQLRTFAQAHLPQVQPVRRGHAACMYTVSPDEHFLLDRHPDHPQVCFAAGLSGHGFKMAAALGEALAQLALDEPPAVDVGFLGLGRPGLSG